jgi:3-oxoacyl-[acyl-carrier-protein] synthase-1
MRRLFGERTLLYSSTKGYTGHPVSAAGAIEAIFTLSMMNGGWIAPSVNAEPLDPELEDYPPVVRPTDAEIRLALSNSFGFGGTNACIVLEKPDRQNSNVTESENSGRVPVWKGTRDLDPLFSRVQRRRRPR